MRVFGGYVKSGQRKINFEITTSNRAKVYSQLKSQYPNWEIKITEEHKLSKRTHK